MNINKLITKLDNLDKSKSNFTQQGGKFEVITTQ